MTPQLWEFPCRGQEAGCCSSSLLGSALDRWLMSSGGGGADTRESYGVMCPVARSASKYIQWAPPALKGIRSVVNASPLGISEHADTVARWSSGLAKNALHRMELIVPQCG